MAKAIQRMIFALLIMIFTSTPVLAVSVGDLIDRQMDESSLQELDQYVKDLDNTAYKSFSFYDTAKNMAMGKQGFSLKSILDGLLKIVLKEVYSVLWILLQVIAISILFSLLSNLNTSFETKGISYATFFGCYALLAGVMLKAFTEAAALAQSAINNASGFVSGMVPMLLTLMVSSGAIASSASLKPLLLGSIQIVTSIIQYFIMPLLCAVAALVVIDNMSDRFSVSHLADMIKKAVKWVLGFVVTLFTVVMMLQSFCSVAIDGASAKAIKYTMGSFVPVVGSILAETIDTLAGCSVIVKNAAGVAGIVALALICLTPVVKMGAISCVFKLSAAVIQPVSDKRIPAVLDSMSQLIGMMAVSVFAVVVLFIICLSMVIMAGNSVVMMR